MTKRIFTVLALAIVFFACTNQKQEEKKTDQEQSEKTVLTVNEVMQNPDQFLDKDIVVKGMVTHVCKHGGKRLHLTQSESNEKLRVRASDKTGNFERELEGSNVIISGKFIEERMDQSYIDNLKTGNDKQEEHSHEDGEHQHETAEESKEEGQAQGVSEEFIAEMQAKIDSSENGYISEYWLESTKIEKK